MLRNAGRCLLDAAAPALVALIAFVVIAAGVAPQATSPASTPGITVDESFNIEQGVYLFESLRLNGWSATDPQTLIDLFAAPESLNDHPPLGRMWLGLFHAWGRGFAQLQSGQPLSFASARVGSAAAFGLTIFVVGLAASRWYGRLAGFAAALSLALMPRVFGHAHLAALETFVGLTYTASVLSIAAFWNGPRRPGWKSAMFNGAIFGIALLSKIQAVLLPVPIIVWTLFRWRLCAIRPLLLWAVTATAVFFAFWPWLWSDPLGRAQAYFMSTTDRLPLNVWYFGRQYTDVEVPWHYAAVLFLTTVPLGLQLLGLRGLSTAQPSFRSDSRAQLLLACLLFPLILFSIPGIAVYDGARLFLVVFPIWAIFIGRGTHCAVEFLTCRLSRTAVLCLSVLFFASQTYGLIATTPVHLSYYNLTVGGLRGAQRLGLELNYWGDSLSPEFLREVSEAVPHGSTIEVFPVLHNHQVETLSDQSAILKAKAIQLEPYSGHNSATERYVLIFRREADLQQFWQHQPNRDTLVELQREGVTLAALYALPPSR